MKFTPHLVIIILCNTQYLQCTYIFSNYLHGQWNRTEIGMAKVLRTAKILLINYS